VLAYGEPFRSRRASSASSWICRSVRTSVASARAVRSAARRSPRLGFLLACAGRRVHRKSLMIPSSPAASHEFRCLLPGPGLSMSPSRRYARNTGTVLTCDKLVSAQMPVDSVGRGVRSSCERLGADQVGERIAARRRPAYRSVRLSGRGVA
jgi:hypothetical protein